jgi:fructose-specific PTS system IIC-like component
MGSIWNDYKDLMRRIPEHLITGVSYMVPTVVGGGLLFSFAIIASGAKGTVPTEGFLGWWAKIGIAGLTMFVPMISAYVAFSMVDRPGLAPGFIGGYLAQQLGGGFIVAVLAGLLAGTVVFFLMRLIKVPTPFIVVKGIILIPIVSCFIVGLFAQAISVPVATAMNWLGGVLKGMAGARILLGAAIGAMDCFDMGGPIGKVAYSTGVAFLSQNIYWPMGAGCVTFPVPPMAMALAVFLARGKKLYRKSEIGAAMSAFILHFVAISEGAIPFAIVDPVRVIGGLMIGGAVAGGLAGALNVESRIPWGSYVGFVSTNNPIGYLLCMYLGSVIGALAVNFFKKPIPDEVLAAEEAEEGVSLFA